MRTQFMTLIKRFAKKITIIAFLNASDIKELLENFARSMEKKNAEGAKLVREYAKMFGG